MYRYASRNVCSECVFVVIPHSAQSHSASASMGTIDQSGPVKSSNTSGRSRRERDEDFFSRFDPPSYTSGGGGDYGGSSSSSNSGFGTASSSSGGGGGGGGNGFGKHSVFSEPSSKPSSKVSSFGGSAWAGSERSSGAKVSGSSGTWSSGSDGAQQRFSNAKSISSDQYFGRNTSTVRPVNMYMCILGIHTA